MRQPTSRYQGSVARPDVAGLDSRDFARIPLDVDALGVRTICTTSNATPVCYLRDLLTAGHKDRATAAFLTCWNVEEFWHGGAIASGAGRPRRQRNIPHQRHAALPRVENQLGPLAHLAGYALAGDSVRPHDLGCNQRVE